MPRRWALIILPQALKLVIPGIVNTLIGLFKDTSLVLIIGIFDLLGMVQSALAAQRWLSPATPMTGYIFAGLVFWIFCFGMSRYSLMLERRFATGGQRAGQGSLRLGGREARPLTGVPGWTRSEGFEVFVSDHDKPFGAVRQISRHGRGEFVVYVKLSVLIFTVPLAPSRPVHVQEGQAPPARSTSACARPQAAHDARTPGSEQPQGAGRSVRPEVPYDVLADGQRCREAGALDAVQRNRPSRPCFSGPWMAKSGTGSPSRYSFGRTPV